MLGPASAVVLVRDRGVLDRVVHLDDLAVRLDGVRDVDGVAHEPRDALGDARLAVAGVAEEEDRLRRVDRRADLVEHLVGDDEVLERLAGCCAG